MFRQCILFVLLGALLAGCSSMSGGGGETAGAAYAPAPTSPTLAQPARSAGAAPVRTTVPTTTPTAPVAAATAQSSLPTPNFGGTQGSNLEYRLGPLDMVSLTVYQVPDLSGQFQIGSDGSLTLPLVGTIKAAGRTAQDVQKEITAKLQANYLQSPQVVLQVSGFNSQRVTVDGAVGKPGVFPVSSSATLLDYIAMAGGLPRTADPANVIVFREVDGKRMSAKFNVSMIRTGKIADPIIYGGDTIIVPTSGVRSVWTDFISAMPLATFVATATGL